MRRLCGLGLQCTWRAAAALLLLLLCAGATAGKGTAGEPGECFNLCLQLATHTLTRMA